LGAARDHYESVEDESQGRRPAGHVVPGVREGCRRKDEFRQGRSQQPQYRLDIRLLHIWQRALPYRNQRSQ
jgi:hypothetical protein